MDTTQFGSTFWLALVASLSAFALIIVNAVNKSKCKSVNCCWDLFSCQRDVKIEEEIEIEQMKQIKPVI